MAREAQQVRFHSTEEQLARNETSIIVSGGWCASNEPYYNLGTFYGGDVTHVALWSASSPIDDDDLDGWDPSE